MGIEQHTLSPVPLDDTARIDRRQAILAQIEAALLADTQSLELQLREGGADPYNTGTDETEAARRWGARAR